MWTLKDRRESSLGELSEAEDVPGLNNVLWGVHGISSLGSFYKIGIVPIF